MKTAVAWLDEMQEVLPPMSPAVRSYLLTLIESIQEHGVREGIRQAQEIIYNPK